METTTQQPTKRNGANGHGPILAKKSKPVYTSKVKPSEQRSALPKEFAKKLHTTSGIIRKRLVQAKLPRSQWKNRRKVLEAIVAAGDVKGADKLFAKEFPPVDGADAVHDTSPVVKRATDPAVITASASPEEETASRSAFYAAWSLPSLCKELGVNDATGYNWLKKIGKSAKESSRREVLEIAVNNRNAIIARRARKLLAAESSSTDAVAPFQEPAPIQTLRAPPSADVMDRRLVIMELKRGSDWLDSRMREQRMHVGDLDDAHIALLTAYRMLTKR